MMINSYNNNIKFRTVAFKNECKQLCPQLAFNKKRLITSMFSVSDEQLRQYILAACIFLKEYAVILNVLTN